MFKDDPVAAQEAQLLSALYHVVAGGVGHGHERGERELEDFEHCVFLDTQMIRMRGSKESSHFAP